MTGIELLKQMPFTAHMVRILLTGYTDGKPCPEAIIRGFICTSPSLETTRIEIRGQSRLRAYLQNKNRHSLADANQRFSELEEVKLGNRDGLRGCKNRDKRIAMPCGAHYAMILHEERVSEEQKKVVDCSSLPTWAESTFPQGRGECPSRMSRPCSSAF